MKNYQLTLFGFVINSKGDLLDALSNIGDSYEEIEAAAKWLDENSFSLGCFNAYEKYLTDRFGEPVRHADGEVAFCK